MSGDLMTDAELWAVASDVTADDHWLRNHPDREPWSPAEERLSALVTKAKTLLAHAATQEKVQAARDLRPCPHCGKRRDQ